MSVGVLVSGIGFTFSLMYATQGCVSTLSDLRRAAGAFGRVRAAPAPALLLGAARGCGLNSHLGWCVLMQLLGDGMHLLRQGRVHAGHGQLLPAQEVYYVNIAVRDSF